MHTRMFYRGGEVTETKRISYDLILIIYQSVDNLK